jgi:hypothetical protein
LNLLAFSRFFGSNPRLAPEKARRRHGTSTALAKLGLTVERKENPDWPLSDGRLLLSPHYINGGNE